MNVFIGYAFIFIIGSVLGWIIEVFFRRFFSSANPERKWLNPGLCTGPYLPLYGTGLVLLYLLSSLDKVEFTSVKAINLIIMFAIMSVSITATEFLFGFVPLKFNKVRLWDYSDRWGNVMGLICPKFSLVWTILGVGYYFLLHKHFVVIFEWAGQGNLAVVFAMGLFYGIMLIDVCVSMQLMSKLKKFAVENNIVVKYEEIKVNIRNFKEKQKEKYHFLFPFHSSRPLSEHLSDWKKSVEDIVNRRKSK